MRPPRGPHSSLGLPETRSHTLGPSAAAPSPHAPLCEAPDCLQCTQSLSEVGAEGSLEDSAVGQDLGPEAGSPVLDLGANIGSGAVCRVDKGVGP